jgi:hypothetical protein
MPAACRLPLGLEFDALQSFAWCWKAQAPPVRPGSPIKSSLLPADIQF